MRTYRFLFICSSVRGHLSSFGYCEECCYEREHGCTIICPSACFQCFGIYSQKQNRWCVLVFSCSAVSNSLAHEMWYLKACHVVVGSGLFAKSWLTLVTPWTLVTHQAPLSWGFSGENTGVGCHFLLQGIFPTRGLNPCLLYLLHCWWILYLLIHLDHMVILCLLFFFFKSQHTLFHSGYTILYSSNSKGSSSPLTFFCFFFF